MQSPRGKHRRAKVIARASETTVPNGITRAVNAHSKQVMYAVNEEAKAKLQEMFGQVDSLSDPQAQIVRFFDAIHQGMPSPEAAEYFLHLEAEQFTKFRAENAETDRLIRDFEGRVALEQYRKVCRDGTPREALEWLKANRAAMWRTTQTVDIKNVGTDQLITLLAGADRGGAS